MEAESPVQLKSDIDRELQRALTNGAKRLIVDATYSGRGHLEAAAYWEKWNTWLGLPAVLASTLLAAGASVSALIEAQPWLTAVLAGTAALLNGARTFLQPEEKSHAHALKGNQYLAICSEARLFRELDLRAGVEPTELSDRLKQLRRKYEELKQGDPLMIPRRAYLSAKRNIEAGETSYENDPMWKELGD